MVIFVAHLAHAASRDDDSSHKGSHDDNGDGNPGKSTGKKNHTATGAAHQFTKTWPPFPESTDSPVGGDDGRRPDPEYVRLLDASFMFYEAQRSGKLPPDQRVKWRNDSALLDGQDAGQDLSGGYFDAGNYMKFTFPLSFVLAETCYGGLEFYEGYILADQTHRLDQMVRWGLDWLLKAHASNNDTLFVQVGVKEVDNEYWGPDTGIPTNPRPAFFVSRSQPGTDVMASTAAAFIACSLLYRDKIQDQGYADTLQSHGEVLYHWAETAQPQQLYQVAVPAVKGLYESSSFWDDLAWASAWMYRMTQNQTFADKAAQYMTRYTQALKPNDYQLPPVGWDDTSGLVYVLMAQLTRGSTMHQQWQTLAEQFAEAMTQAKAPCRFTPGGMLFCDGYSDDNSLVVIENAALTMYLLAHDMEDLSSSSSDSNKVDAYKAFALKQVRYLLGENPEKTPYVVGIHPNSPKNPHSAQASGGNSTLTIDTYPVEEAHVLLGAVVGGPDERDQFLDIRNGWRHTEVALDYNAPFTALMAYQVMTSQDPPPYVTIPRGSSSQQKNSAGSLAPWKIALLVIFVGLLLPGLAMYLFYRRKKTQIHAWVAARRGREGCFATKDDTLSSSSTSTTTATATDLPSHLSESVSTVNVAGHGVLGDKDPIAEKNAIVESRSASPVSPSNDQLVNSTVSLQTLESIEVHK
ncbi:hypothetical protein KVV02_002645 [Mortierella alpina]|uniref:Endoglucanase n=1 Tax=Mortierella alpina TaxID=64518 RepID=A0A9P8AAK4_MORAP|nr:hypothetical protein KVV02_002645 [Mortierella alpina]